MPEIKVNIPEGDYCDGCPFLTKEVKPIVDIMGNLKKTEENYICLRHRSILPLETEEAPVTPCGVFWDIKIKKSALCKMECSIGEEAANAFYCLVIAALLMSKEGEDDAEIKGLPDGSNSQNA